MNGKIDYTITEELETIICPSCEAEFLIQFVVRDDEGREEPQLWLWGKWYCCPMCGAKSENESNQGDMK